MGYTADISLAVKDVFNDSGEYESLFCCPPYADLEQWNFDSTGKCIDIYLNCDQWIDVCFERYKCGKYLFVVDDTVVKYKKYIVEKLDNRSNFGNNSEYVVFIDENCYE